MTTKGCIINVVGFAIGAGVGNAIEPDVGLLVGGVVAVGAIELIKMFIDDRPSGYGKPFESIEGDTDYWKSQDPNYWGNSK